MTAAGPGGDGGGGARGVRDLGSKGTTGGAGWWRTSHAGAAWAPGARGSRCRLPLPELQPITDVPLHSEVGRPLPAPWPLSSGTDVPFHGGPPAAAAAPVGLTCRNPRPSRRLETGAPWAASARSPTAPPCARPACPAFPLRSRSLRFDASTRAASLPAPCMRTPCPASSCPTTRTSSFPSSASSPRSRPGERSGRGSASWASRSRSLSASGCSSRSRG
jgi:hypothetical protein